MTAPNAGRPHMPGYGIAGPDGGSGLLPWSWAEERLVASKNYWVATVWPDGRPHVMPVWGAWYAGGFTFSSGGHSRKVRNLAGNPHCTVATENPHQPVVIEGTATLLTQRSDLEAFVEATTGKYDMAYELEFLAANATVRVTPNWAFALDDAEFTTTPTRWRFD